MHATGPSRPPAASLPASGCHLMDASMFWGPIGGVRRVLGTKHALLGRQGWQHTVLAPGVQGAGTLDCGGLLVPGTGGYRLALRQGHAERLIEQARPDVVEAADPYTLAWAVLGATRRLGVPSVAFCHSNLPALAARLVGGPEGLATRRGRWAARRARQYLVNLYARFDLVMAPSQCLTERLQAWGVPHAVHQPLGVDTSVFTPVAADPASRHTLCLRLGLRPDTRLLVYSGRFAPEKNLPLLTEAVRLLGPGVALLAVGSGPCPPPRAPNVFMLRPEHDGPLARLLASCDAYVHAGDQETFGLGVLEAMACGTPVVVCGRGGLGELAQDVGTTVHCQRPHEWAEAIRATLAGREPVAAGALERARRHDWLQVMPQFSRRYLSLVRRHEARAAPVPALAAASSGR